MSARLRRWASLLARLTVSAALIAWVLSSIEWRVVAESWLLADRRLLIASGAVLLLSNLLGGAQWFLFLRARTIDISLGGALRAYFVGLFFNNFLPSGMGGDAVKVYDVGWRTGRAGDVLAATVADRLLGLVVLTGLAVVAVVAAEQTAELQRSAWLVWLFFVGLAGLGIAIARPSLLRPLGFLLPLVPDRIKAPSRGLFERLHSLVRRPRLLIPLTALSTLIQTLRIVVHALTGLALGLKLPFSVYAAVVPVLGVLINLPSINGVGIREGGGVLLFAEANVSPEMAVSMQLLTYGVMVLLSLIGGVLFALGRRR